MTSGSVGVFPKNFLEPTAVKAPASNAAKTATQQAPTGRTKTVVMRPKDQIDKQTRRNIVSEMPISSVSITKLLGPNVSSTRENGPRESICRH